MKRAIILFTLLLITKTGFSQPSVSPALTWYGDITFQDSTLWVGMSNGWLFAVDKSSATIIDSIDTGIMDAIDGVVYAKNHLWVTHAFSNTIQKIDPVTKTVVHTFTHNISSLATHGIEYFNNHFYLNILFGNGPDTTFVFDTLFNYQNKFPNHAEYCHGIACNGSNFYITVNHSIFTFPAQVYKYDLNFNLLDSFPAPGGNYPNGLAFYKECLWLANADALEIYEMCEIPLNVEPDFNRQQTNVYPNPAVDHFYIQDPVPIEHIQLISSTGQILREQNDLNELERIDLEGIMPGKIYLRIIHNDGTFAMRQIIIGVD